MHIVFIGLNYTPEIVGIGPYTTQLAEHLVQSGHKVSVLTGFPYYPHWRIDSNYRHKRPYYAEIINGVRVIRSPILLPGIRQSAARRILFDSSLAVTSIVRSVVVGRIDLVICVSPPLQLGLLAWLTARSHGTRFVLHLQDLVPDAALSAGMLREGAAAGLARRLERFVYSRADLITVIGPGFLANLLHKGVSQNKLRLLPNWVETGKFDVASDPAVRATLGASNAETLVLYAGNMGAKQGLETVVDAASQLVNDHVTFALIGDGSQRHELEARARQMSLTNVKFLPLQDDFPATLAAADLLVLAQRGAVVDSVAPSKLLSYMASGKPVVAAVNARSEASTIISEASCGLVVAPEDPTALARAILQLRRRPDLCARMGDAGRRFAVERYDRAHGLKQWLELVQAESR